MQDSETKIKEKKEWEEAELAKFPRPPKISANRKAYFESLFESGNALMSKRNGFEDDLLKRT